MILASQNETFKQIAAHGDSFIILFFPTFSSFMHHVKLKQNSRDTPRKRSLHVMHHFYTITPIISLFHESHPEKIVNHSITPTAGGASKYISSTWTSLALPALIVMRDLAHLL